MKTLEFNRKSWHFWVATKIGDYSERSGDFCSYVRNVIGGLLLMGFLAVAATLLLFSIGREVWAIYTCHFTSVCTFGSFERAFAIFVCICVAVVSFIGLCIWNGNRMRAKRWAIERGDLPEPKPSFITTAYRALKDKTCFKVEFK
jgi:hypothetical protein